MTKKIILFLALSGILSIGLQSCKASKGCGCKTNLNHYNPKRGRVR